MTQTNPAVQKVEKKYKLTGSSDRMQTNTSGVYNLESKVEIL